MRKYAKLSPRTMALAYRIWCHCKSESWSDYATIGEALGETPERVRRIFEIKGWGYRLESQKRHDLSGKTLPLAGVQVEVKSALRAAGDMLRRDGTILSE